MTTLNNDDDHDENDDYGDSDSHGDDDNRDGNIDDGDLVVVGDDVDDGDVFIANLRVYLQGCGEPLQLLHITPCAHLVSGHCPPF